MTRARFTAGVTTPVEGRGVMILAMDTAMASWMKGEGVSFFLQSGDEVVALRLTVASYRGRGPATRKTRETKLEVVAQVPWEVEVHVDYN
jgi:hypothetical protein